ncbi:F-box protein [Tanacetum coccineum]
MPESGTKSRYVNNGKAVESVNSHQSAWLTHWTGSRVETSTHDHLTQFSRGGGNDYDFKKQLSGVEKASDNFDSSKGIKDVDLTMSLKKPGSQSFPFFRIGQQSGRTEVEAQPLNIETLSISHQRGENTHVYLASKQLFKGLHRVASSLPMNQYLTRYKRMQKHIGMGFFPNQTTSPQHTKPRPMHHGSISHQNIPQFVHDLEELAGGLHTFSRTTHSVLITKQTDVKVYQESQIFRESRVSTQLKGEALRELNFSPLQFGQGQRGLKLQLLDSSDHESQDNVETVKPTGDVQKNESSADTDAVDMESSKKNNLSGVHLSLRNKEIMEASSLPHLPPIDTSRKRKIELPDINLEVSDVPAASGSIEKAEPCTSRTQSFDMNALQFNVDNTSHSNSNECSNSNMGSEAGSRWIKRLKLSASSNLALGTKTSKLAEPSSHGKKLAEPSSHGKLKDKCHGKESESVMAESCSVDTHTKRDCKDITLSHSWIQRWSHSQNQKNAAIVETDKPEDSKFTTDELQKKQFPSIAAMALMGKAMTGFQQCKFQKKESFVVWNTKAFE